MKIIAFFNHKSGAGKTTLVYHLAHMLAKMGYTVIAADIDPQANLTSMFAPDEESEIMWDENDYNIYGMVSPLIKATGDIRTDLQTEITDNLHLLPGGLKLSRYEDLLSETWHKCLEQDEHAFRVQTAFARIMHAAAGEQNADFVLVDIGPNLGAINRAALTACDYVVTPLLPDLYSWQGLKNFGGQFKKWYKDWEERKAKVPQNLKDDNEFFIPPGRVKPLGYIIMRYSIRLDLPTKSLEKWIEKMPAAFRELLPLPQENIPSADDDPYRLAILKDYFSLIPMAQEARKPMFKLKPGDGALGAHLGAVQSCYKDFRALAKSIIERSQH